MSAERDALLARYNTLTDRAAELETQTCEPQREHYQVLALLNELVSMIPADAGPVGGLLKMLHRLEPHLVRDFAAVPVEQVRVFCHELGTRMLAVGAPEPAKVSDDGSDDRADIAAAT